MILAFSIPEMRPYIEAGIRQANGEHVTERVKRQTIRAVKGGTSPWLKLLGRPHLYDLHLWWKTPRVKGSEPLGRVPCRDAEMIKIRNRSRDVYISHRGRHYGPDGQTSGQLKAIIEDDGFDTVAAFRDFFVPNPGDVFEGVLIKW